MKLPALLRYGLWWLAFLPPTCGLCQNTGDSVSIQLAELNRLFANIYACPADYRWNASDSFSLFAQEVLEKYQGREFPFEKVKNLNYYKGEDLSFRMLNWGVPEAEGTVSYKALLQVRRTTKNDYLLYDLNDMSLYQPFPEQIPGTAENWWGAFYYDCIPQKVGNRTYYTFLGWNSGQELYQQSVIEPMYIKPDGQVQFGASLFVNKGKVPGSAKTDRSRKDPDLKRVVFRFGRKTGMILRYDYQAYLQKNAKGKKTEKKANMIIFDRLMPQQTAMADDYAYYVPEGGIYQAYVFENGKWRLHEDIVARNPDPKKRKKNTSSNH
ncbi:MAG: hypothetical protein NC324_04775 [Bacteroides sp.]|nr:hypothetical protein [Bacteroides sp.]